jgi:integrase
MASVYRDSARNGWRAQVVIRGVTRKLWIGPITATGAKQIAGHLDNLKASAETATPPAADSLRWARAACPRIQSQLAKWGLIEISNRHDLPRSVVEYARKYSLEIGEAASTRKRWANVVKKLEIFGSATLAGVTPGDCDRIARDLRKAYKSSHAGKILSDFKQIFTAAIKDRLITDNPFDAIDCRSQHDKSREAFIDRETVEKLLGNADPQFRALISLARYAGLRVPSEPLALKWEHIDWAESKITILAPKTGHRICPLFAEIREPLQTLWELAPTGATHVFHRGRASAATVWRAKLESIILASSVKPWPKLWQNMRASCRTDLEARFPAFVCNAWLGHSSKVAEKHYSRVTADHFNLAVGQSNLACGVAGGVAKPSATDSTRQQ